MWRQGRWGKGGESGWGRTRGQAVGVPRMLSLLQLQLRRASCESGASGQTPYRDASGCGMDRALTGLVHCALGTDVGACGVSPSLERGTGHIAGHHRAAALVCRINRACHKEYMYTHGPSCFHVKQGVAPRRVAKLQDCLSTSKGWLWVHVRGRCFALYTEVVLNDHVLNALRLRRGALLQSLTLGRLSFCRQAWTTRLNHGTSVTQRALSITQRALSVTQRALSVTQRPRRRVDTMVMQMESPLRSPARSRVPSRRHSAVDEPAAAAKPAVSQVRAALALSLLRSLLQPTAAAHHRRRVWLCRQHVASDVCSSSAAPSSAVKRPTHRGNESGFCSKIAASA
jgi:hypothetical protein